MKVISVTTTERGLIDHHQIYTCANQAELYLNEYLRIVLDEECEQETILLTLPEIKDKIEKLNEEAFEEGESHPFSDRQVSIKEIELYVIDKKIYNK